jgi:cell division septation protein DedD
MNESTMTDNIIAAEESAVTNNAAAVSYPVEAVPVIQPEPRVMSGTLTLIPADERIPAAPAQTAAVSQNAPRSINTYAPPAEFSPFQAPLISSLTPGKWYVQIGVYSRPDNVEDEIGRIGTAYPIAIQNVGTDTSPIFRVLLGPLNQGESGAMLQRFRSIGYADAFVRQN